MASGTRYKQRATLITPSTPASLPQTVSRTASSCHSNRVLAKLFRSASSVGSAQNNLTVSSPNDPAEREAEQVAAEVMRMPEEAVPTKIGTAPPHIHRKCSACEEEENQLQRSATEESPARIPSIVSSVLSSPGARLPTATRAFLEPRFGQDFSQVRVHTSGQAAESAAAVRAKAYTVGNDIVFGQRESPTGNLHLLAHELAHVVQQSSGQESLVGSVRKTGIRDKATLFPQLMRQASDAGSPVCNNSSRLDSIAQTYRDMIADARGRGANIAADNLQHFLTGSGTKRSLPVNWLRGFSSLLSAERKNQERFEKSLNDISNGLKDGEVRNFADNWDRMFTAGVTEELYYASGTSTVRSSGNFEIKRSKDTVSITGRVNHHWFDPYDWHAGLRAYIPGHGSVSDQDALEVQQCRGAKPYDMEADWSQTLNATIEVGWVYNKKQFNWNGP